MATPKPTAPLLPGAELGDFRVLRLLGRGGMGEVYLARDVRLGRRVALKVLHPGGEAAERLLKEAQATAAFSHPGIVTLYAVGEHAGVFYAALEYVEGATLRERLREGRASIKEAIRITKAIAEALREAHGREIAHLDLKPENVLVAKDGRVRVADFGLARVVGRDQPPASDSDRLYGTPAYLSPEQWRGEGVGTPSDVWALGVLLHELVFGAHPLAALPHRELVDAVTSATPVPRLPTPAGAPEALLELTWACLAKAAAARPGAADVVRILDEMDIGSRRLDPHAGPFRGLLPMTEDHADLFFGRDAELALFFERMREEPILPVVGPSGAGKSSFVMAGVIPRLREELAWEVISLRPGADPLRTLASRLSVPTGRLPGLGELSTHSLDEPELEPPPGGAADEDGQTALLAAQLHAEPRLLSVTLRALAEEKKTRVFLYVDQLEEVFTLVEQPSVRERFLRAIFTCADDANDPVRVCFSLRDDFLGRAAEEEHARAALSRLLVLGTPGRAALVDILEKPAARAGYHYDDPGLVGEIVDGLRGEAALPLLAFLARMLWDRRDPKQRTLRRRDHDAVGGVAGALATHADGVLAGLPATDVRVARDLFLRLVAADGTRRVLRRADVLSGLPPQAAAVLARLTTARLVVARRGASGEADPSLEIVHESMIHGWRTLARWLDEGREEVALLDDATRAAELWERRGRRDEALWTAGALHDAQRLLVRRALPESVARFLGAAEKLEGRRRRRRRRLAAGGVAALLLALATSLVIAVVIAGKEREARLQERRARAQLAATMREGARAAWAQGDPLEARARLRRSLEIEDAPAARALWQTLRRDPLVFRREVGGAVYRAVFSPDGSQIAVASQDGSVYLVETHTAALRTLGTSDDQVTSVAFTPDGETVIAGTWKGRLTWWPLDGSPPTSRTAHEGGVRTLAVAGDGHLVVTGSADRTVRLWDGARREVVAVLTGHAGIVSSVDLAGDRLASGSGDGVVRLWSPADGRLLHSLVGHRASVTYVGFSPDGRSLVSSSMDRTVRIWDVATGASLHVFSDFRDEVNGVKYSPDGRLIAVASNGRDVVLIDATTGETRKRFTGHEDFVRTVDFSPDGRYLVSGGNDRRVCLWDLAAEDDGVVARGHERPATRVSFSPDGERLATASVDRTIRLWDRRTGEPRGVFAGHTQRVFAVVFLPDGERIASASGDQTVRIWHLASGTVERTFVHGAAVRDVAIAEGGRTLISAGYDFNAELWDMETGGSKGRLAGHTDRIPTIAVSADGRLLATASYDSTIRLWSVRDQRLLGVLTGHTDGVDGVVFSHDGRTLFSTSHDRTVRKWDVASGASELVTTYSARLYGIAISPDDRRIAIAAADSTAHIYELGTLAHIALLGHRREVNDIVFSPDGGQVATVADDAAVRLWDAASGAPVWRARAVLGDGRTLSHNGWSGPGAPAAAWREAVERGLWTVEADGTVCLATADGRVELWDTGSEALVARAPLEDVRVLIPRGPACLVEAAGVAWWLSAAGLRPLATEVTAIAPDLVATRGGVLDVDGAGNAVGWTALASPVTALARVEGGQVLGYANGTLVSGVSGGLSFRDTPASPVLIIRPGPPGTVLAGYGNGVLGLWSIADGTRLESLRLHGPIRHVALVASVVTVVSELGDTARWRMASFSDTRCELLRKVWADVGVVWEGGLAVPRPPPAGDPCH